MTFTPFKPNGTPTPGPWTTEAHGNTTALYSGRTNLLHGLRIMNLDDGDWNFEANRKLIEAAPVIFRELDAIAAALEDGDTVVIEPGSVKAGRIEAALNIVKGLSK